MAIFPSQQWLDLYFDGINNSEEYAEAAKNWDGDVLAIVGAVQYGEASKDVAAHMVFRHGKCLSAEYVEMLGDQKAEFTLNASYASWKRVFKRELDPSLLVLMGKLKFSGPLVRAAQNLQATRILAKIASEVPTEFVDETDCHAQDCRD